MWSNVDGLLLIVGDIGMVIVEGVDWICSYFVGDFVVIFVCVDWFEKGDVIVI